MHKMLLLMTLVLSCSTRRHETNCFGSPGESCSSEGQGCQGPSEVCWSCAPGIYLRDDLECTCVHSVFQCNPVETPCPIGTDSGFALDGLYADPNCAVPYGAPDAS